VAEFIQMLGRGEMRVPHKWAEKGYPGGGHVRDGLLLGLRDSDKKYLRVYYEVMDRYPREKFKYEEQQIRVLEQIRNELRRKSGKHGGGSSGGGDHDDKGSAIVAGDADPIADPDPVIVADSTDTAEADAAPAADPVVDVPVHGEPGSLHMLISAHDKGVNAVAFAPDGNLLASGSVDMSIKLWEVPTGVMRSAHLPLVNKQSSEVTSVAFSPTGALMARGHHANPIRVDGFANGTLEPRLELIGHQGWVPVVTFSPDGNRLASASLDLTARIWDMETGQSLLTLKGHDDTASEIAVGVWGVAFSPDGKTVATGASDAAVILWDAETGEARTTLRAHHGLVFSVAFSPDGRLLASSSEDSTVILWDVEKGKLRARLKGHDGWVVCVAFSPDGSTLASASYDTTVRLWDVGTKKTRHVFGGHEGAAHYVAFSPDGRLLASGSNDGNVRLWNL
jgi:WD40 repeat protein